VQSVATTAGTGTPTTGNYTYNAEGDTTARPGETLYMGGTELHKDGTGSVYAVRTYSLAGTPVAERTNGPTGGNTLRWLGDSNHNTATIEVVASSGATTVRYEDPYGNARGANPAWSSGHTFLNDDQAATSGTVTIGARTYDPVIGKFLSVDAVLAPMNPQQNNGYSYAANDPVTLADPTGLDPAMHQCDTTDTAACRNYFYGGAWTDRAPAAAGKSPSSRLGAYLNSTTGVPTNLNVDAANACGWNSVCISQQPDRYAAGPGYHPTPGLANGCHSLKSCAIRLGTVAWGVCLIACGGFGDAADAVGGGIVEQQLTRGSDAGVGAEDWAQISGVLRDAASGKGNFGLGSATEEEAEIAGKSWVGDDYRVASDGKTLISQDGLRQWRPTSYKPNLDKWQSNFEHRSVPQGAWQSNGHLDLTDRP
jgi:RHS repeat-associated protein